MNHELELQQVKGIVIELATMNAQANNVSKEELAQILCEIADLLRKPGETK